MLHKLAWVLGYDIRWSWFAFIIGYGAAIVHVVLGGVLWTYLMNRREREWREAMKHLDPLAKKKHQGKDLRGPRSSRQPDSRSR